MRPRSLEGPRKVEKTGSIRRLSDGDWIRKEAWPSHVMRQPEVGRVATVVGESGWDGGGD